MNGTCEPWKKDDPRGVLQAVASTEATPVQIREMGEEIKEEQQQSCRPGPYGDALFDR